jgi:DNA replication factor GINS
MNLDELQSVQARERQSSDLQHLRSSFYREVGEFIQELTQERAQAVDRADDPFSSPEVRQLSNDIETAEQTVEAIYERRVGKVVKKASIAAAGMPVDTEGLTDEEASLFDDLVVRIENNRENVLSVLDGDAPSVSCSVDSTEDDRIGTETESPSASPSPDSDATPEVDAQSDPTPDTEGVSAADLMGSGPDESADPTEAPTSEAETGTATESEPTADSTPDPDADALTASEAEASAPPEEPPTPEPGAESADASRTEVQPDDAPPGVGSEDTPASDEQTSTDESSEESADESSTIPGLPRTTVRITDDIGEVVGADNRDYDLGSEDVVTLPEPNADVLVDKGAAERLD